MSQEDEYKKQLEGERASEKNTQPDTSSRDTNQSENGKPKSKINPKKLAKNITSAISLPSLMEIRDIFFAFAATMATLKDIFDLGIIGTILTPFAFIVIVAAMLVCGSKNFFGKKKAATIIFGNLIELIPGLNFLPAEITTVVIIYIFILRERQEAKAIEEERINAEMAGEYA
jgi:hypothetical protein